MIEYSDTGASSPVALLLFIVGNLFLKCVSVSVGTHFTQLQQLTASNKVNTSLLSDILTYVPADIFLNPGQEIV